jgi:hypothetical protein
VAALINGKPSPATVDDGQQVTLTLQNNQAICCQMSGPVCNGQQTMVAGIEPLPSARPPEMPGMLTRAVNLGKAALAEAAAIARGDPNGTSCTACGCDVQGDFIAAARFRSKTCPKGKRPAT